VSGLSRKRASEAETAAALWSIVQLARQAGPIAKTAGAAARGGAKNATTWAAPHVNQARARTAPYVNQARTWTAPHIERSGLAIRDTIAPKIYEALVATARRMDVTPPTPPTPPRRRRWPKLVAGTAIAAAAASAAAAVALRRQAKDGTPESPGEVAGAAGGSPEAQPAADDSPEAQPAAGGSPEAQQPLAEADGSRAGPEAASPSPG
jgi:hypothetical protein